MGALDDIPGIIGDISDNWAKEDEGEVVVDGSSVQSGSTGIERESVDRRE